MRAAMGRWTERRDGLDHRGNGVDVRVVYKPAERPLEGGSGSNDFMKPV